MQFETKGNRVDSRRNTLYEKIKCAKGNSLNSLWYRSKQEDNNHKTLGN